MQVHIVQSSGVSWCAEWSNTAEDMIVRHKPYTELASSEEYNYAESVANTASYCHDEWARGWIASRWCNFLYTYELELDYRDSLYGGVKESFSEYGWRSLSCCNFEVGRTSSTSGLERITVSQDFFATEGQRAGGFWTMGLNTLFTSSNSSYILCVSQLIKPYEFVKHLLYKGEKVLVSF